MLNFRRTLPEDINHFDHCIFNTRQPVIINTQWIIFLFVLHIMAFLPYCLAIKRLDSALRLRPSQIFQPET